MLQGRTIYVRLESVRRYLWEKIEEWQWRKAGSRMARALAAYDFVADPEAGLARMAENETESMILHELGEARAGELLGPRWEEMIASVARTGAETPARAVRDLLADCLSTLPALVARENLPALHFHFATFDSPRRELFPQALEAYEESLRGGSLAPLERVAREGSERFLAEARWPESWSASCWSRLSRRPTSADSWSPSIVLRWRCWNVRWRRASSATSTPRSSSTTCMSSSSAISATVR
jgi:hypothetical protein